MFELKAVRLAAGCATGHLAKPRTSLCYLYIFRTVLPNIEMFSRQTSFRAIDAFRNRSLRGRRGNKLQTTKTMPVAQPIRILDSGASHQKKKDLEASPNQISRHRMGSHILSRIPSSSSNSETSLSCVPRHTNMALASWEGEGGREGALVALKSLAGSHRRAGDRAPNRGAIVFSRFQQVRAC